MILLIAQKRVFRLAETIDKRLCNAKSKNNLMSYLEKDCLLNNNVLDTLLKLKSKFWDF